VDEFCEFVVSLLARLLKLWTRHHLGFLVD
jgi:hypothetical protein